MDLEIIVKLESKQFSGTFKVGEDEFPATFEVRADYDGRLQISLMPLPTQHALALQNTIGEPGSPVQNISLTGSNENGETFLSHTVSVSGVRMTIPNDNPGQIRLSMREAKVAGVLDSPALYPAMRLWFRGFKSSFNAPVKTLLGLVEVRGSYKSVDASEMSGFVAVHADDGTDLGGWAEKADNFLTFMHRGLAFARGGRLQTPGVEHYFGDRWEATYYDGSGFQGGLAPIHHLNQGPFIGALAKRFEEPKPFPDMLWTAVGMMNTDTSFDAVRLLMSMTALDAIVEHIMPKSMTTVMPKADFLNVRDKLLATLSEVPLDDEVYRDILSSKIKQLNNRTLAQKLQTLRDYYALPSSVFTDEAIAEATKRRNAIAHPGGSSDKNEIWPKIILVREFVSQIVFHEIGYAGPYENYAVGYKTVQAKLDPAKPATSPLPNSKEI